jgi:hypothetical protein
MDSVNGASDMARLKEQGDVIADPNDPPIAISVVMPCLNEEESVGLCVEKAWIGIRSTGLTGEVIVSDNGSSDGSVAVAEAAGARVVHQPLRGYGNAYLKGFSEARGSIIAMGDSDDSYDFTVLPELVTPLLEGNDYVLGSRRSGEMERGAMSWSHRYIGNPVLTTILNILFKLKVSDAHSGFRVFTREALDRMDLQCEGMEFASEIVVKAARANLRVAEVPITYHPRIGKSKLNSLSDGWRHLRFLLLLSPTFLFMIPGLLLLLVGLLGEGVLFGMSGGVSVLVIKTLLAIAVVLGIQLLVLGSAAVGTAESLHLGKAVRISQWVHTGSAAKQGFIGGTILFGAGLLLLLLGYLEGWATIAGGGLSASFVILSLLMTVLGVTLWFDAFFLGLFETKTVRFTPQMSRSATEDRVQELTPAANW